MGKEKIEIDVEKAIALHKKGYSIPQIANRYNCGKATIKRAFDRVGYIPRLTLEKRKKNAKKA